LGYQGSMDLYNLDHLRGIPTRHHNQGLGRQESCMAKPDRLPCHHLQLHHR